MQLPLHSPPPLLILLNCQRKERFQHEQSNGNAQCPPHRISFTLGHLPDGQKSMAGKDNPRENRFNRSKHFCHLGQTHSN